MAFKPAVEVVVIRAETTNAPIPSEADDGSRISGAEVFQ
jgi:hypothetical protein